MLQRLFLAVMATLSLYLFFQSAEISNNSLLLGEDFSEFSNSFIGSLLPQK